VSDLSLPPDYAVVPSAVYDNIKLVKLAREIAMDMRDVPDVLRDHDITQAEFNKLQHNPIFINLLASEVAAWNDARNISERVKVKAGSMIEEFLPELYARINDKREPLLATVKALEYAARLAGMGQQDIKQQLNPGDRVQVVINLGADSKLSYEKRLPSKVIDHEASNELQSGLSENVPDQV
jgi:hypothetical protein